MTPETLKSHVTINSEGCWIWTLHCDRDGYGKVRMDGKTWQAHRAAFALNAGPIAESAVIHHTCRTRACCNPWHLEAATAFENTMRGISPPACNARKVRCNHGHHFDAANTYRHNNRRDCKACNRAAVARYKAKGAPGSDAGCSPPAMQCGAP